MEEWILNSLTFIEEWKLKAMIALPKEISMKIDSLESEVKNYPPLLVFIFILFSIMILKRLVKILPLLFKLETYTVFVFSICKNILLKKRLEKERKTLYQFCMEGMKIDKTENSKIKVFQNSQDISRILGLFEEILQKDKSQFSKSNKQTGCVYTTNQDISIIAEKAAELYAFSDLNFPELYPSAKKIENNLLEIMLDLFHADKDGCGITTTGGTESIMLSLLAAKMYALDKGIKHPNVILPITVHPAFDKGCQTFGLNMIKIDLDKNYKMNINQVKSKIDNDTVLIVGSAINYPHGVIDDIESLSKIALKNDLLFHVDACMGGFLTCFYEDFISDWKPLDFKLPGVTMISVDIHKYGMTQKGVSVLLFKNKKLRSFASFGMVGNDGLVSNPSIACSRSAYLVASGYMTLIYHGRKLYADQAKRIRNVIMKIKDEAKVKTPKLEVIGDPQVSIFSFTGEKIGCIHKEMKTKGWAMNLINMPLGVAFCITSDSLPNFENGTFMKDFIESYKNIYEGNNGKETSGLAAMYGVAAMLPEEILLANMDVVVDCILDTKESLNSVINKK